MTALNSFTLFKKYTTNQNEKGSKGYASMDIILDCVDKMGVTRERRRKDDADDESLTSTSTVPTPPPCK
jgi:hypothetical protein